MLTVLNLIIVLFSIRYCICSLEIHTEIGAKSHDFCNLLSNCTVRKEKGEK